jgi:hypothetical protein
MGCSSSLHRIGPAALAAALLALGAACAHPVSVDFDPQEDFARYRTWAWLPPAWPVPAATGRVTPELDAALRSAIERELADRGFAAAAEGEPPDFFVSYHLALSKQLVLRNETPATETLPTLHGGRGDFGAYEIGRTELRIVAYEIGLLGLDVADGRERQLVWRGITRLRVRNRFSDRADDAVAEIFESFPPKPAAR